MAGFPSIDDLESDTFDGNRLYDASILDAGWEDVEEALLIESELVASADVQSSSVEEFDAILQSDLEDHEFERLGMLDVGIASAVLALAAADCVTSSSCRGHHTPIGGFPLPEVVCWTDEQRAALVRDVAAGTGCSFTVDEDGRASVWGPSVTDLMSFARGVIAIRATFDAFPRRPIE